MLRQRSANIKVDSKTNRLTVRITNNSFLATDSTSSNFMMLKLEEYVFRIGAGMVCVTMPELPDIATKID